MTHFAFLKSEKGSFYLEMAVGSMIFFISLLALLGMFAGASQLLSTGKTDAVTMGVVNKLLEQVRATKYDLIGFDPAYTTLQPNEPGGVFKRDEDVTENGLTYNVHREITWVDDPGDGTGAGDVTGEGPNDYKRIAVSVRRPNRPWIKMASDVKLIMLTTTKPSVTFIPPSDSDGSRVVVGGPTGDPRYQDDGLLTSSLAIPLVVNANDDPDSTTGLTSAGFYVEGSILQVVSGSWASNPNPQALITFSPPRMNWTDDGAHPEIPGNGIVYWNPFITDVNGNRVYHDGERTIMVQVWNADGGRDSRMITYILDKNPPIWPDSSVITASALDDTKIRLTWSAAKEGPNDADGSNWTPDVIQYKIIRDNDTAHPIYVTTAARLYDDSGLPQWSTHSYKIYPISAGGREGPELTGSSATATTMITLTVTPGTKKNQDVVLSWAKPLGITVTKYQIFRTGTSSRTITITDPTILNQTNVVYSDTRPGTGTYTYRLVATLSGGQTNSSPSVTVNVP